MASEAFAGVGTKFQRWSGSVWEDIAEVNAIEGPGMTKDTIEVTSIDTDAGYNEFITGFAEGGTVTLDMNFTRETYEIMKDDFESDAVCNYRIQLADYDSEPSTFTFGGLVIELPMGISADDKVTADVVIQVTSQVVLDIGSTVPAEPSEEPLPVDSEDSTGSGAGWVAPGKYALVNLTGFEEGDADGFIEFRFYHVVDRSMRVFASCSTAFETRQISVYVAYNHCYFFIRNAISGLNNLIYSTGNLTEGWHTVRWTSTNGPASSDGGEYICEIDGTPVALTVSSGANDGRWFNKVASSLRTNVSIGATVTTSVIGSEGGWLDYVNYNNEHIWYLDENVGVLEDTVGNVDLTWQ